MIFFSLRNFLQFCYFLQLPVSFSLLGPNVYSVPLNIPSNVHSGWKIKHYDALKQDMKINNLNHLLMKIEKEDFIFSLQIFDNLNFSDAEWSGWIYVICPCLLIVNMLKYYTIVFLKLFFVKSLQSFCQNTELAKQQNTAFNVEGH